MKNHRGFIIIINRRLFPASHSKVIWKQPLFAAQQLWIFFPSSSPDFLHLGSLLFAHTFTWWRRESLKENVALDLYIERRCEARNTPSEILKTVEMEKYEEWKCRKNTALAPKRQETSSQLHHSLAVWSWTDFITSLSLFLLLPSGIIPCFTGFWNKLTGMNLPAQCLAHLQKHCLAPCSTSPSPPLQLILTWEADLTWFFPGSQGWM